MLLLQGAVAANRNRGSKRIWASGKNKKIDKIFQLGIFIHNSEKTQPRKRFESPLRILGGLNGDGFPCKGVCSVKCVDNNTVKWNIKKKKKKTEK